jgi:hypothetical protein
MSTKGAVGLHNVVPKLYNDIINEVISSVKEDFMNEGLDESVLEELKKLWNKKLKDSKALENPAEVEKKRVCQFYITHFSDVRITEIRNINPIFSLIDNFKYCDVRL